MYRKTIKNTLSQLIGRLIASTVAFLTTLALARYLGASIYGEYTKAAAFVLLFFPLTDLGLNLIFMKLEKNTEQAGINALLGLRLGLSFFVVGIAEVIVALLWFFNPLFNLDVLVATSIALLALPANALLLTTQAWLQKKLLFGTQTLILNGGGVVVFGLLVGGLFFLKNSTSSMLLWASACFVLTTAIPGLIGYASLLKKWGRGDRFVNWELWKQMLGASWPLGLTLMFNMVYFRLDTLILGGVRSSGEVGAYGLAYKFFEFALVIPTFVMNSAYPILIKEEKWSEIKNRLWFISLGLLLSSTLVASALFFGAPFLTLVKHEFGDSIVYLRILSLFLPIFYLSSPLMWVYVLQNKQRRLVIIYGLTMVINVLLNVRFIPSFGAQAAAVITGVTELIVLILGVIGIIVSPQKTQRSLS